MRGERPTTCRVQSSCLLEPASLLPSSTPTRSSEISHTSALSIVVSTTSNFTRFTSPHPPSVHLALSYLLLKNLWVQRREEAGEIWRMNEARGLDEKEKKKKVKDTYHVLSYSQPWTCRVSTCRSHQRHPPQESTESYRQMSRSTHLRHDCRRLS